MDRELYIRNLYIQKFDILCNYAYFFTSNFEASRDIVQDVFMEFFENSIDNTISNVDGYLYRGVRNRCCSYIRKRGVKDKCLEEITHLLLDSTENDFSEVEYNELNLAIERAIKNLPEMRGRIFTMSRFEGKTYVQIAEELGISVKTVEGHMTKSLKSIRNSTDRLDLLILFYICSNI